MSDETIKCGRVTYILRDGDTVLDNGSCLQLISRQISKGFYSYSPRVSRQAFNEFKNRVNVTGNKSGKLTKWIYSTPAKG